MLFDDNKTHFPKQEQPLAERVRPQSFNDIIGHEKIWSSGSPLRKLVEEDRFSSFILWGPPGTGKTSLAKVIGEQSTRNLVALSAVHAGVKDIRKELLASEEQVNQGQKATLIFMDEVHRLSKNQQDVLLPGIESGTVRFIGATTENPSFEVNSAILSRSLVFRLESLSTDALIKIMNNALTGNSQGFKTTNLSDEVLLAIAQSAGGDARKSLSLLDAVICSVDETNQEVSLEHLEKLKDCLPIRYDKQGDNHYDTASALIKSIRASHPDAAVYYLARMIDAGEDERFIARRLVIAASEDIGNANPTALLIATNGMQAVHMVGMPEARIILSQITTYLASSPKSNRAYKAIDLALGDVKKMGSLEIPMHLRNAPTQMMKNFGYGKNYQYAHDKPEEARKLPYLPKELKGRKYYIPSQIGVEKQLLQNLEKLRPFVD